MLREGSLDERMIEVELPQNNGKNGILGGDKSSGMVFDASSQPAGVVVGEIFRMARGGSAKKPEKKKVPISEARPIIAESESGETMSVCVYRFYLISSSEKLLEEYDVIKEAIQIVEESGIVFIDEIDKLVNASDYKGADASSEGLCV